ncbi:protein-L-isoaspartate(D-aspartate) O-methyltransferase [Chitinispirillales bacterium ANBcel5]|uniref:protein-L-isoaspartate(D-aspartate) O-methyltransferase n=1 Tax=Cellulosispirillum alkaliphilum TaxID=3039283 RepID=UPI002A57D742|nr:protein-L-isoaspartate(D-aspartate) O-methyltransferase [Chitinispirillales bacterium ANBcel5]
MKNSGKKMAALNDTSKITSYKLLSFISVISVFVVICCFSVNAGEIKTESQFREMRERMVSEQIEARGITNREVVGALKSVKRHKFVPDSVRFLSYGDHPLPIGEGQTISQPFIVALMTQVIEPHTEMRVLEIGTGSGYQAAVLAELCKEVYTIEIVESLGKRAKKVLDDLCDNVYVKIGDGYKGWPDHAPFDAIIVTCSPTHVPEPLIEQLKDGGKMIIPVGEDGSQELVLMTKIGDELKKDAIIPVRFVPMVDFEGKTY